VSQAKKAIKAWPSRGGNPPGFTSARGALADGIAEKMRKVYQSDAVPPYLDKPAARLLEEARASFHTYGLTGRALLAHGTGTILFPWVGTRAQTALALSLGTRRFQAETTHFAIEVAASPEAVRAALEKFASAPSPEGAALAAALPSCVLDKYDDYLDARQRAMSCASAMLDCARIPNIARVLLETGDRLP
jgi:ATP-dependent Lhr-like helicase